MKPGDLVALFMANSPDFVFAWLGLFAIGAAPALINHNLTKAALLHCLAISDAPLVLANGRPELLARIEDVKDELAAKGVRVVRLADVRAEINGMKAERPLDRLREDVKPGSPFGLFYTRWVIDDPRSEKKTPPLIILVAQRACRRLASYQRRRDSVTVLV